MSEALVIELLTELIKAAMLISAPLILSVVFVGVAMNILQTVTQIKDQTVLFVPKVVVSAVVLVAGAPWYLEILRTYFERMMELISQGAL